MILASVLVTLAPLAWCGNNAIRRLSTGQAPIKLLQYCTFHREILGSQQPQHADSPCLIVSNGESRQLPERTELFAILICRRGYPSTRTAPFLRQSQGPGAELMELQQHPPQDFEHSSLSSQLQYRPLELCDYAELKVGADHFFYDLAQDKKIGTN